MRCVSFFGKFTSGSRFFFNEYFIYNKKHYINLINLTKGETKEEKKKTISNI